MKKEKAKIQFDVITIFPEALTSYVNTSLLKKAQEKNLLKINFINLRDFATDKHKTVDDRPYGGGPGMILKVEPIYRAVKFLKKKRRFRKQKVILFSPKGKILNQKKVKELAQYRRLILICGRYEGVDARVEKFVDEIISIGPYILSGGELPAMVLIEAVSRYIPGVIGHKEATKEESFEDNLLEYPQYTRPQKFKIGNKVYSVPKILLTGNHQKIKEWRLKKQKKLNVNKLWM